MLIPRRWKAPGWKRHTKRVMISHMFSPRVNSMPCAEVLFRMLQRGQTWKRADKPCWGAYCLQKTDNQPRSAGDQAWRPGENAWACRAALGLKKCARADHHDILEKRISGFLGYHGDLRVQIFLDQARRGRPTHFLRGATLDPPLTVNQRTKVHDDWKKSSHAQISHDTDSVTMETTAVYGHVDRLHFDISGSEETSALSWRSLTGKMMRETGTSVFVSLTLQPSSTVSTTIKKRQDLINIPLSLPLTNADHAQCTRLFCTWYHMNVSLYLSLSLSLSLFLSLSLSLSLTRTGHAQYTKRFRAWYFLYISLFLHLTNTGHAQCTKRFSAWYIFFLWYGPWCKRLTFSMIASPVARQICRLDQPWAPSGNMALAKYKPIFTRARWVLLTQSSGSRCNAWPCTTIQR